MDSQYQMIVSGTCKSAGLVPITNKITCEVAATTLYLEDTSAVTSNNDAEAPEGCYLWGSQTVPWELRLSLSEASSGKGGGSVPFGSGTVFQQPICFRNVTVPSEKNFDYPNPVFRSIPDVPDYHACAAHCQEDGSCWAWTWTVADRSCALRGPRVDPWANKTSKDGVVSGVSFIPRPPPGTLFGWALMMPFLDNERRLLKLQYEKGWSIFGCDDHAVYSSEVIKISSGLQTHLVNHDLKCEIGGEYHLCLNTEIFIAVWKTVLESGRPRNADWTVKVDPDSVFLPDRLRTILSKHPDPPQGVYLNNCKFGLHGPVEVFSRNAMQTYLARNNDCINGKLDWKYWGEDMYMDQCLWKVLNVLRVKEYDLISEDHCQKTDDWKLCATGHTTFHPFKEPDGYRACMHNITALDHAAS
jgi:hypothetical protein